MANPNEKQVFISIGGRYTHDQNAFLDALITVLERCGVTPRVMNKTRKDYPTGSPLMAIHNVLQECHGAVIVAFERKYFPEGVEYRGGGSDVEVKLHSTRYTTPWNQIEAAMAFARGIPIMVLAENGLHEEGLLEQKFDWYVQHLSIQPDSLAQHEVGQRIQVWCEKLSADITPGISRNVDENWTLFELIGKLTLKTVIQVALLFSIVFGGGVAVGKWLHTPPVATSAQRT